MKRIKKTPVAKPNPNLNVERAINNTLVFTLRAPRITEKSGMVAERNVHVFDVPTSATKLQIAKAVMTQYKVAPRRVNIVNTHSKRVVVRGKLGKTAATKKAYVFLKKGDTLKLI